MTSVTIPQLKAKFVKRYAELGQALTTAVQEYAKDVRSGRFPGPEHCYQAGRAAVNGKTSRGPFSVAGKTRSDSTSGPTDIRIRPQPSREC